MVVLLTMMMTTKKNTILALLTEEDKGQRQLEAGRDGHRQEVAARLQREENPREEEVGAADEAEGEAEGEAEAEGTGAAAVEAEEVVNARELLWRQPPTRFFSISAARTLRFDK